ncbi:glycosyltransferase family 4 protein [Propionivibrio sp.]|uniref:glycosyltransferase family 4 protein n=1 Tax=Propionivibrio sp. TaxID=2212460 RepID=UPI002618D8AE|nr:glycosyltransferase family 4 protein [Propionivibrio sp.]
MNSTFAASAPRPLTILHTEWSDGWGGQERRIYSEMQGMRERGHRVLLATRPGCILANRAEDVGLPVSYFPFSGKFDLHTVLRLRRFILEAGVDIVNTHSGIDSWVGGMAARLAGVSLVRTRHLNLPLKRSWHNFVHFLPHRIVTCGQSMLENLRDNERFPAVQLTSIPTGIDFTQFRPHRERAEVRAEFVLSDAGVQTPFIVLMVAVIRAVKRHEVAIDAFASFHRQHPDSLLLLAGEGPMHAQVEAMCAARGIADAVRFLGHREDIPDLMSAADALILTSRSEGVPQVVTQALGLGLPVIATAVGGVPELVINDRTGLLVPPENPTATAAALCRLYDDAPLRERLSTAGRAHALAHFSHEAMLDATEKLYAQLRRH